MNVRGERLPGGSVALDRVRGAGGSLWERPSCSRQAEGWTPRRQVRAREHRADGEFSDLSGAQRVRREIGRSWPCGDKTRAGLLWLRRAILAYPDWVRDGNAGSRPHSLERRGNRRRRLAPIGRRRIREAGRGSVGRAEQPGSGGMGACRQDSGTRRFQGLCLPYWQGTHEYRRDLHRHKLRHNKYRFWLDRWRRRACGGWLNRRPQDRLALHQEIQRVVVLLLGVGLTMGRGTEFVLLQLAHDAEFFAAVEALHAICVIGGMGEMEEVGKALWPPPVANDQIDT